MRKECPSFHAATNTDINNGDAQPGNDTSKCRQIEEKIGNVGRIGADRQEWLCSRIVGRPFA